MSVYITAYDSKKRNLEVEFSTSSFDVSEIVNEFDWKKDGDYASVLGAEPTQADEKILMDLRDKLFAAKKKKFKEIKTELKVISSGKYDSKKDAVNEFVQAVEAIVAKIEASNEKVFKEEGTENATRDEWETLAAELEDEIKNVIKFIETFSPETTKESLTGNALNVLDHADAAISLNWAEYVVVSAIAANGFLRRE